MKKLFSLTLAMVTALGLMLPASAAEETTDEALARVTQAVKAALDLDTDAYDEFQGSWYEDGLTGAWDLYWSTELEEELSISALDDGTVISYDLGLPYTASNSGDFPVFPQGDEAAAARAAVLVRESIALRKKRRPLRAAALSETLSDPRRCAALRGGDTQVLTSSPPSRAMRLPRCTPPQDCLRSSADPRWSSTRRRACRARWQR